MLFNITSRSFERRGFMCFKYLFVFLYYRRDLKYYD
jgi:hypothetical protein